MNQRRRIFFAIFGLYHIFVFIFVIYVESRKDLSDLLSLYNSLKLFKYGALLGVVLFAIDVIWNFIEMRTARKEHETLRHENNTLKAKVYDLQQSPKQPVKETPSPGAKWLFALSCKLQAINFSPSHIYKEVLILQELHAKDSYLGLILILNFKSGIK